MKWQHCQTMRLPTADAFRDHQRCFPTHHCCHKPISRDVVDGAFQIVGRFCNKPQLLIGDNITDTDHPLIFKAMEESADWETLSQGSSEILQAIESHNCQQSRDIMGQFVSGFTPHSVIVDWFGKTQLTEKA